MADFHQLSLSFESLWFFNNVLISSHFPTATKSPIEPEEKQSQKQGQKQSKSSIDDEIDREESNPILGSPVIEQDVGKKEEEEEDKGSRSAELVFESKPEPASERRKRMMRRLKSRRKMSLGEVDFCLDKTWASGGGGGSGGRSYYYHHGAPASQRVMMGSPMNDSPVIRRSISHGVTCSVK